MRLVDVKERLAMTTRTPDPGARARRGTRRLRAVVSALVTVGITCALLSSPATAQTTGSETFHGVLVVSGAAGTRDVVSSVIVARGVFTGVGRIVERENLPGDPENISRDDLVFADGVIHIVNDTLDATFELNPRSCVGRFTAQQATTVEGGTGRFAGASGSFAAAVNARGLLRRNPDGSCAANQAPLFELDKLTGRGTLSF
jgi:hypothetical protein